MSISSLPRELKELKVIKELKKGGKSKYVHLLEGDIVKKKYDGNRRDHKKHFENEVMILKHMAHSGHVPRILYLDLENYTIYMSYCGSNPYKPNAQTLEKLRSLMIELRNNWGLIRYEEDSNGYREIVDTVGWHNVCEKDSRLYLIDFGSEKWEIINR